MYNVQWKKLIRETKVRQGCAINTSLHNLNRRNDEPMQGEQLGLDGLEGWLPALRCRRRAPPPAARGRRGALLASGGGAAALRHARVLALQLSIDALQGLARLERRPPVGGPVGVGSMVRQQQPRESGLGTRGQGCSGQSARGSRGRRRQCSQAPAPGARAASGENGLGDAGRQALLLQRVDQVPLGALQGTKGGAGSRRACGWRPRQRCHGLQHAHPAEPAGARA